MKRVYKIAVACMLVASGTMPMSGMVNADITTAMSGTVICGYNFDNYKDFSNWNLKNVNDSGEIYIENVRFYDEFGRIETEWKYFDPFPPWHYGVISPYIIFGGSST